MVWQDIVISLSGVVIAAPLIPTILNEDSQVPRSTSIPIGSALFVIGTTYLTMGLTFAGCMSYIEVFLWYYIAWKRPVGE